MKKFDLFEIKPNSEELRSFREEYIKTFKGSPLCKIISKTDKWYKSDTGVYAASKLGIGVVPVTRGNEYKKRALDLEKFISFGPCNVNQARAIKIKQKYDYKVNYFYLLERPCASSSKHNGFYTPSLLINEDIYNMIMIQFRRFKNTTTPQDLSRYQKYFTVGDAYAHLEFSQSMLEDLFRCSVMPYEQIDAMMHDLELEEIAVKSLRKK